MKKLLLILSLGSVFALSACHTIQGVGKDIQAVGETIEGSARHHDDDHRHH